MIPTVVVNKISRPEGTLRTQNPRKALNATLLGSWQTHDI